MPEIPGRFQQGFHFIAAENQRQLSFTPGKRNTIDGDCPVQRVGIKKAERADHLDVGRQRYFFLFDEEQLIPANVLSAELIGWFAEVSGKLGYRAQINTDRGG